jgi:hypothetical protein
VAGPFRHIPHPRSSCGCENGVPWEGEGHGHKGGNAGGNSARAWESRVRPRTRGRVCANAGGRGGKGQGRPPKMGAGRFRPFRGQERPNAH